MDAILRGEIDRGFVIVYMDDILIFHKDLNEHRKIIKRVMRILEENKLYLKPEKCTFESQTIEYLGLIISEGRIAMDPVKVKGLSEWPIPKNVKEVQSFIGFANFY